MGENIDVLKLKSKITRLETDNNLLRAENNTLRVDIIELKARVTNLEAENRRLRMDVDDLLARLVKFETGMNGK